MLLAVADRDAYANLLLPRLLGQRQLSGRDAALATELTYGALRGRGTYDVVLDICCDRDLDSLDPAVRESCGSAPISCSRPGSGRMRPWPLR